MSTVLVTGGTGFIGSWVLRKLLAKGASVVTYSRHRDTTLIKDIADKVDYVAGDVLDLPNLIQTIRRFGVERVIHMAASLTLQLETNPFSGYRANVDGALNIFEACRLMDIKRLVCTSSKAVYDIARGEYGPPTYKPIDEDYPKAPHTVYGATKLFMENMGLIYNRMYGLDFVALRFAATYGPGKQPERHAFSIINEIIDSAMLGKPLKVSGNADQKNDMIYVKDAANGIVLACFAKNLNHRIFHLGTGKGETIRHLIESVAEIPGSVLAQIVPELESTASRISGNNYVFNISRACEELGYSPQYYLDEGVKDYIETTRRLNINSAVIH